MVYPFVCDGAVFNLLIEAESEVKVGRAELVRLCVGDDLFQHEALSRGKGSDMF